MPQENFSTLKCRAPLNFNLNFNFISKTFFSSCFGFFFAGRPEPTVTWFMGTTPIQTGGGVSMGRHVTVNRLEIQHVKRDALNNTYVCQASNTKLVPPAERTVRVEMLRKCQKDYWKKFKTHKFSLPSNENHYVEYAHIITVQNIFPIHSQNLFLKHI